MSDLRELACEFLRLFYEQGWVSGTGGGLCALEAPGRLLLAPTGVHKERVRSADLFVVDPSKCEVLEGPSHLKPSECGGVFSAVIRSRGAGAVAHSHGLSCVLAGDAADDALTIERLEMLKGIPGVGNRDRHEVPVVENTEREPDLVSDVERVLADARYETAHAILVRDHGAYIWGADIWEAKKHCEVYHWLFEAVVARSKEGP